MLPQEKNPYANGFRLTPEIWYSTGSVSSQNLGSQDVRYARYVPGMFVHVL